MAAPSRREIQPREAKAHLAVLAEVQSLEIVRYSRLLFGAAEQVNYDGLSPFAPYALYQAAVIQRQMLERCSDPTYELNYQFLKLILAHYGKRWLVAGKLISTPTETEQH